MKGLFDGLKHYLKSLGIILNADIGMIMAELVLKWKFFMGDFIVIQGILSKMNICEMIAACIYSEDPIISILISDYSRMNQQSGNYFFCEIFWILYL